MKKIAMALVCSAAMSYSISSLALGTNGQVQGTLGVKLVIGSGCQVTGGTTSGTTNGFGTLDFGTQSSLVSIIHAQSSVSGTPLQLNCTTGTPYFVSLDNGANALLLQRRMNNGTGTYVTYNLYQDAAYLVPWTSAVPLTGTGTGSAVNLIVYGGIPVQVTPASGTYTDTVMVTVSW